MKHVTVCYTKNAPLILFMIQMWKQIFNIHKKVVHVSQQEHNFYPMRKLFVAAYETGQELCREASEPQ